MLKTVVLLFIFLMLFYYFEIEIFYYYFYDYFWMNFWMASIKTFFYNISFSENRFIICYLSLESKKIADSCCYQINDFHSNC